VIKLFKNNLRIKFSLFIITLAIALLFFLINLFLVNQFRNELNKQVKTIVNIYHDKLTNENVDSEYLLKTIIPLIDDLNIPIVITTKKTDGSFNFESINLKEKFSKNSSTYIDDMTNIIKVMDKNNKPLTVVEFEGNPIIQIHYGDSIIINSIKWLSLIEFGFIFFVIIFFVFAIYLILSNEKNHIYVGMAKEAAHQLGTPISSLLGWLKLLESGNSNRKEIYDYMGEDIKKLENVSHKFNKIGSRPKLIKIDLIKLLNGIVNYYKKKLPESSDIDIYIKSDKEEYYIEGDEILLYWAFENIIKNSIDSVKNKGYISLNIFKNKKYWNIDVTDNGVGIFRKNRKNIFKPGFSTKSRGWGLGLNLSKRIIENMHKGSLKLLSSNSNKTIFRIKLHIFVS
tara:strand:- start:8925 stop:10118 length:1194 start_codon:yes stop_codon:yes gene_type:complete